jgi:two-component system sensor histidine kinase MprB
MTLKTRLTLLTAAAVALAILIASAVIFYTTRNQLGAELDRSLRRSAAPLVLAQRQAGILGPRQLIMALPGGSLDAFTNYIQVFSSNGETASPLGDPILEPSDSARRVADEGGEMFSTETIGGESARVYTVAVEPGIAIQVARATEEMDASLRRLGLILILVSGGGIALAAAAGRVVANNALVPVRRLTETTEHVSTTGDLTRRIQVEGNDELARLAASFNSMMGALDEARETQRQLVADASHELRTPLTSLRTNIEVLAADDRMDKASRRRLLDDVVSQLTELTDLVGDLVDLARGSQKTFEVDDISFDALVASAVERAARRWPDIRFETSLEPFLIRGTPERIDRAITNLLDNGAKWSPEGGVVEVAAAEGELRVRDHGPGIDEDDLPHVFDRFYRSAEARGMPGSGLGLAIVRQVAEAHSAAVEASNAPDGGGLFKIRFPVSS